MRSRWCWLGGGSLPRERHHLQRPARLGNGKTQPGERATIADMDIRQRDVAAFDAKNTKALADAKAALQRKIDNSGRGSRQTDLATVPV
ncbi:lysis system i-spanin subunit Rz [Citrobacter enshiensis]|uniref:lysis system i-spanin subunit Rz n=1 Tax=Citrobacter enshiensis TaxID=2971264 RepID=UPI00399D6138